MKSFKRKGAVAALLGALALLSGCGSSQSNPYNSNNPYGYFGGGSGGGGGGSGCYPVTQPIPFSIQGPYLSGVQMCSGTVVERNGTTLSCPVPTGAMIGGTGASPTSYFRDQGVDGMVSMEITPPTQEWAPALVNQYGRSTPSMTGGSVRGTIMLGALTVQTLQSMGGPQTCVTAVRAVNSGFTNGNLFSTRIMIQWQGANASGTDVLYF